MGCAGEPAQLPRGTATEGGKLGGTAKAGSVGAGSISHSQVGVGGGSGNGTAVLAAETAADEATDSDATATVAATVIERVETCMGYGGAARMAALSPAA